MKQNLKQKNNRKLKPLPISVVPSLNFLNDSPNSPGTNYIEGSPKL